MGQLGVIALYRYVRIVIYTNSKYALPHGILTPQSLLYLQLSFEGSFKIISIFFQATLLSIGCFNLHLQFRSLGAAWETRVSDIDLADGVEVAKLRIYENNVLHTHNIV